MIKLCGSDTPLSAADLMIDEREAVARPTCPLTGGWVAGVTFLALTTLLLLATGLLNLMRLQSWCSQEAALLSFSGGLFCLFFLVAHVAYLYSLPEHNYLDKTQGEQVKTSSYQIPPYTEHSTHRRTHTPFAKEGSLRVEDRPILDERELRSIRGLATTHGFIAFSQRGLTTSLNNLYPHPITVHSRELKQDDKALFPGCNFTFCFLDAESAYQWAKCALYLAQNYYAQSPQLRDRLIALGALFENVDGRRARELGKDFAKTGCKTPKNWKTDKYGLMLAIVRCKFANGEMARALEATGDSFLLMYDLNSYWGCGKEGAGQNRMGQLLMQVRHENRAKKQPSPQSPPENTPASIRSYFLKCEEAKKISSENSLSYLKKIQL